MFTSPSAKVTGLEVTRATTEDAQRWLTNAQREFDRRLAEARRSGRAAKPVIGMLNQAGWMGDQPEQEWYSLVRLAVEKKLALLASYKPASRHDLLVYDDTDLPAVDRRKVLARLRPWVLDLRRRAPALGKVSVIISLDLLYDIGRTARILPYVEPIQPETADQAVALSKSAEQAGQVEVQKALNLAVAKRQSLYFIDSRGRLVKESPDGRFEVKIREDGEETVVRRISPE